MRLNKPNFSPPRLASPEISTLEPEDWAQLTEGEDTGPAPFDSSPLNHLRVISETIERLK